MDMHMATLARVGNANGWGVGKPLKYAAVACASRVSQMGSRPDFCAPCGGWAASPLHRIAGSQLGSNDVVKNKSIDRTEKAVTGNSAPKV